MAGHDRWTSDRDRFRRSEGRGRDRDYERLGPESDHFTRRDRESFARGDEFGHSSRDYPGGGYPDDYRRERSSMGRRGEYGGEWEGARGHHGRTFQYRGPRDRQWGAYPRPEADYWRDGDRHRGEQGRSVGEMAFGREQGGRSDPGEFGRASGRHRSGWFDRMGEEIASWFGGEHDEDRIRRLDLRESEGAGRHRGRGPKSYQRSDERILEDINDRLTEDPQLDASDIEVSVSGREVTLSGTVAHRFDKRRAEDLADSVSGVTHVQNNLRVSAATDLSADRAPGTAEAGGTAPGGPETPPRKPAG